MPSVVAHYHVRIDNDNNRMYNDYFLSNIFFKFLDQIQNYNFNDIKYESLSYSPHHLHVSNNSSFQQQQFDFNHNSVNGRVHMTFPLSQTSIPIEPTQSVPSSNNTHVLLGARSSSGSNVLMLPPNHHPRGGSLPDLRSENSFHHPQLSSSTISSPPTSTPLQTIFRLSSLQKNGNDDLYILVKKNFILAK